VQPPVRAVLAQVKGSHTSAGWLLQLGVSGDTVERLLPGRTRPGADLVGLLAEELERPPLFMSEREDVELWEERQQRRPADRQLLLDTAATEGVRRMVEDAAPRERVAELLSEQRR